jgi:hypothetical protein
MVTRRTGARHPTLGLWVGATCRLEPGEHRVCIAALADLNQEGRVHRRTAQVLAEYLRVSQPLNLNLRRTDVRIGLQAVGLQGAAPGCTTSQSKP